MRSASRRSLGVLVGTEFDDDQLEAPGDDRGQRLRPLGNPASSSAPSHCSTWKQVDLVREVVGDLPATGVLCFVGADWPLIGGAFSTRSVHVLWPKRLAQVLVSPGKGDIEVQTVRSRLAHRFPAA